MKSELTGKIKVPKESNYSEYYTRDSASFQNVFNITSKIDLSCEVCEFQKLQLENIRKALEIANKPKIKEKKAGFGKDCLAVCKGNLAKLSNNDDA